jgi:hypothetical protein
VPQEQSNQWQALVGRSAPAFQSIRAAVAAGPWRPFKQQVCWLLLLLAAKSSSNRALLSRLQRTTLTPLAMQLENAERFAVQAELQLLALESAAAVDGASQQHSRSSSQPSAAVEQQSPSRPSSASANPSPSRGVATAADAGQVQQQQRQQQQADDDDELSAEVALFGLVSRGGSSRGGGDGA